MKGITVVTLFCAGIACLVGGMFLSTTHLAWLTLSIVGFIGFVGIGYLLSFKWESEVPGSTGL